MPTRTVKSRSRKPAKRKSRKPAKKSRKPKKRKSRKPARKKSRKPARKKSRKRKSKFKIIRGHSTSSNRGNESTTHGTKRRLAERREGRRRQQGAIEVRKRDRPRNKDRVFKKHGSLGEGRKLKKKTIPSLFELAAKQLPHVSEWGEDENLHLKYWTTEPQQKGLKKIMGSDLIKEVSSRVEPVGDIEPLSEREIDILMEAAFDFNDLHISENDVNEVYSTLKNLREIPEDHIPNQFFHSYADRRREAKESYERKLNQNLQDVKDDIRAVEEELRSEGKPFDFEKDFTFEDDQGNMVTGYAATRAERQFLDQLALDDYKHRLAIAESYRNDLYNYAYAAVVDYAKYGDDGWLMDDFGDDNELYHSWEEEHYA